MNANPDNRVELDEINYDRKQSKFEDEGLFLLNADEQINEIKFKMIIEGQNATGCSGIPNN